MRVFPVMTAQIPPFMGGKNLRSPQQKEKEIEYLKKKVEVRK